MTSQQFLGGTVSRDLLNAALRNPHLQAVAKKHGIDLGDGASLQQLTAAAGLKVRGSGPASAEDKALGSLATASKSRALGLYAAVATMR